MDFKVKIIQTLDELGKLTGKGEFDGIRARVEAETDPTKLFLKWQALREALAELRGQNEDVSFTIDTPTGVKTYKNMEELIQDGELQASIVAAAKNRQTSDPGTPA